MNSPPYSAKDGGIIANSQWILAEILWILTLDVETGKQEREDGTFPLFYCMSEAGQGKAERRAPEIFQGLKKMERTGKNEKDWRQWKDSKDSV